MPTAAPWELRIAELERLLTAALGEIQELKAENAELRARLGMNSRNSSKPPSSDAPGVERPKKKPTGLKRGGQPGHPHHGRKLFPPEMVDEVMELVPKACEHCGDALHGRDPEPFCRQIVDLPSIKPRITELRHHAVLCDGCGKVTRGRTPRGVPAGAFGTGIMAILAMLTARLGVAKRPAQEFLSDVLGVDLCLGSVSKIEQVVSAATAERVEEVREYLRTQPAVHIDETGWAEDKKKAWLWAAGAALAAAFTIVRSRGGEVARQILGEDFAGITISDRWSGYAWLNAVRRQVCWAHLKRDSRGMVERGGVGARIGGALLAEHKRMFKWWHEVRNGKLERARFQLRMKAVERRVGKLLFEGEVRAEKRTAGMCKAIRTLEPALWTFVRVEGVEPTNNAGERDIRKAVVYRKNCFGTDSEKGSRYVERMLTVMTTLRKQKRHVFEIGRAHV